MSDIHSVGLDLFSFSDNGIRKPVSRITLYVNNEDDQVYTAGNDTGLELSATCIYATQEMANTLLSMAKGEQYRMYETQAANLDPAAELGDGIEVGGITSVIAQINDNGDGYPDVSASGEQEVEDEYPGASRQGPLQRELARARSLITKTNERISFEIYGEDGKGGLSGKMATYTVALSTISSKVESVETKAAEDLEAAKKDFTVKLTSYSTIEQTDKKIATEVRSVKEYTDGKVSDLDTAVSQKLTSYSTIEQTDEKIATRVAKGSLISEINQSPETVQISASKINLNGYVSFTALETGPDEEAGQTVINGSWIGTSTLQGKKIKGAKYYDDKEIGRLRLAVESSDGTNYPWLIFDAENEDEDVKQLFSIVPVRVDYGWVSMQMLDLPVLNVKDGVVSPTKLWDMRSVNMVASSKNYGEGNPPTDAVEGQVYFKLIS